MYISLDWISDYVNLEGLSIEEIVNRLTLATAEVEGTVMIQRFVKNVLVGEIVSAKKLSEKLTFCEVNCGKTANGGKRFQTVCAAPNVRVGLKAAFAPAGTTLAGGVLVAKTELAGRPSEGILCSAAELGLSSWHEILLECPVETPPGTPLIDLVPETDTLIEIDNKSLTHRPDLWGHYGFAREFAAIFHRPLKPLEQIDLTAFDTLPKYPLEVLDTENCPAYGCIEFQTKGTIPSPLFMQRRLHALGMRSYNLLVDVTNYVNWELGQPTHAFDAEKLGGIRVAQMGKEEKLITLDGQIRNLLPEDLLIWGRQENTENSEEKQCNDYRPVAIAGIMGGAETEVTEKTTKILLESANFKAARIRKTSGRLDLRTDASQRYEKTQPPSNVKVGLARILKLIEESGAGLEILSRFTLSGDLRERDRHIVLPAGKLDARAGIALPQEQVLSILKSLGFKAQYQSADNGAQELVVDVPPFRSEKDISIPEDIIEEVLRVHGYDNIPPIMPRQAIAPLPVEKHMKLEHKIRRLLSGAHRFLEVHNYIWFNDLWLKTLNFEPASSGSQTLLLKNSTTPETTRLRTTLLPNLLALVPKNRPYRDKFRLFELGRTFHAVGEERKCNEKHALAAIAFQQSGSLEDFYLNAKSAVEDTLKILGLAQHRFVLLEKAASSTVCPWATPETAVSVQILHGANFVTVGHLGVCEKTLMSRISPEGGQIAWFELDLDLVCGNSLCSNQADSPATLFPQVTFKEPPRFPLSWQDFSLVWPIGDGFEKLESLIEAFSHPLIVRREFLVSYKGKGLDKGTASYSFRFWIGAADRTLSGNEIDEFHQSFLAYIQSKNIVLRA